MTFTSCIIPLLVLCLLVTVTPALHACPGRKSRCMPDNITQSLTKMKRFLWPPHAECRRYSAKVSFLASEKTTHCQSLPPPCFAVGINKSALLSIPTRLCRNRRKLFQPRFFLGLLVGWQFRSEDQGFHADRKAAYLIDSHELHFSSDIDRRHSQDARPAELCCLAAWSSSGFRQQSEPAIAGGRSSVLASDLFSSDCNLDHIAIGT